MSGKKHWTMEMNNNVYNNYHFLIMQWLIIWNHWVQYIKKYSETAQNATSTTAPTAGDCLTSNSVRKANFTGICLVGSWRTHHGGLVSEGFGIQEKPPFVWCFVMPGYGWTMMILWPCWNFCWWGFWDSNGSTRSHRLDKQCPCLAVVQWSFEKQTGKDLGMFTSSDCWFTSSFLYVWHVSYGF